MLQVIINEINGERNLQQVTKNLASRYNENYAELKDTVINFINENGYLFTINNFSSVNESVGNWDFQVPLNISIELTNYCNLKCKHCYNNCSIDNDNFIDKNEILSLLHDLKNLGLSSVELTGGEPLSHPNFNEIVEYCLKSFNLVAIITNGTLVDHEKIQIFKKYKNKLMIQVSLNGSNENFVDSFCNVKGTFKKVKNTLKQFNNENIPCVVAIAITPKNIKDIFNTVSLIKTLGINKWRYSFTIPVGRGASDEFIFTKEDIEIFKTEFEKLNNLLGSEEQERIVLLNEKIVSSNNMLRNCGAGSKNLAIDPSLNVKLCLLSNIHNHDFSFGKINSKNIEEILSKIAKKRIDQINCPSDEICGDCKFNMFCNGCIIRGCMKYDEIKGDCKWGEIFKNDLNIL
ncbi:MAG: radical SAM protein [Methanobrevibacter sp.]|jgi:radical SAM protein with 4Fe4S-binding SPASM domain|nr:radical SAM protein [Candidatus Methanovirga australis]